MLSPHFPVCINSVIMWGFIWLIKTSSFWVISQRTWITLPLSLQWGHGEVDEGLLHSDCGEGRKKALTWGCFGEMILRKKEKHINIGCWKWEWRDLLMSCGVLEIHSRGKHLSPSRFPGIFFSGFDWFMFCVWAFQIHIYELQHVTNHSITCILSIIFTAGTCQLSRIFYQQKAIWIDDLANRSLWTIHLQSACTPQQAPFGLHIQLGDSC